MPLTIKSNDSTNLLIQIADLSRVSESEGYGGCSLDPAIRKVIDFRYESKYNDDDDIVIIDDADSDVRLIINGQEIPLEE